MSGPSPAELNENLKRQNLKWNWDEIAADCVSNPKLIPHLLKACVDSEVRVQQNAGAVLGKIIDLDQKVLVPHLPAVVKNVKTDPHDAVKRATMRVLQTIEIPGELESEIFDLAMGYVSDFREAVAVRAFSMTVARRICERYPPLRQELLPLVKGFFEQKSSAGILARARAELKILEALPDE